MIEITKDEVNAFNIISAQSQNAKTQLDVAQSAQKAMISLLEIKYDAVFDDKTGQFTPKKEVEKEPL